MKQLILICYLLFLFLPLYTYAEISGNPKKVSLYWDKSFSMGDPERLTEDEIELVSEYLKGLKNVSVEIVRANKRKRPADAGLVCTIPGGLTASPGTCQYKHAGVPAPALVIPPR